MDNYVVKIEIKIDAGISKKVEVLGEVTFTREKLHQSNMALRPFITPQSTPITHASTYEKQPFLDFIL